jgi:hypothetical protein
MNRSPKTVSRKPSAGDAAAREGPTPEGSTRAAAALEALAKAARERPVPWSAARAARVERSIDRGRERSRWAAPAARLALGCLASVVLFASFVRASRVIRLDLPREGEAADAPMVAGPRVAAPETGDLDRPLGDGGFADSGE